MRLSVGTWPRRLWNGIRPRRSAERRGGIAVPAIVVAAVVVAGGAGVALAVGEHHHASTERAAAVTQPYVAPAVMFIGQRHGSVPWSHPLRVAVTAASLHSVTVTDAQGASVAGTLNPVADEWISTHRLVPRNHYNVQLTLTDLRGRTVHQTARVKASPASHHVTATLSPDGQTVGVGEPITVTFNQAVPDKLKAAVEQRLTVRTRPAVEGAWHWMSDQEVHWRPPTYWHPHTHVTVTSDLSDIYFGHGYWGDGKHSAHFKIGQSHISTVDVTSHQMVVRSNGKVIRTIPVSTGRSEYPTKGGVHIALSKSPSVIMDSATVGIPKGSPGYYYETVYWDVRISNGGAFVHAAPWSVVDQGVTNVSHGCVNVSTDNAIWFYNFSQIGDVVNIIHAYVGPDSWDPGMSDWNMSWHQWLKGDALSPHFTGSGTSASG